MESPVLLLISIVIAVTLSPLAAVISKRVGLVSRPTGTSLSLHETPVPVVGAPVILLSMILPTVGWVSSTLSWVPPVVAAGALGAIDDLRSLSVAVRIGGLTATGILVALALPGDASPGTVAFAIVMTLAMTNAVNLIDGQNGIAAGVGALTAAALGITGVDEASWLANGFVGSLCGFLVWNFPRGRIFLGNNGSYAVGTLLAILMMFQVERGLSGVLVGIVASSVLLFEIAFTIFRRVAAGGNLTQGDRSHSYDLLAEKLGRTRSTLVMWAFTMATVAAAWVMHDEDISLMWVSTVLILAGAFACGVALWKKLPRTSGRRP